MIGSKTSMSDGSLNRFRKTNLFFTEDKYLLYQDPTYLGFKLLFLYDQENSGLLSTKPEHVNTAMGYLSRLGSSGSKGDVYRMDYLNKFITHLIEINAKTPWFFQSIGGLDAAWKHGYQEDSFKAGLPKDRKISITCEESIDLRMTALMDFYRKACFDWKNRREVVPWNLRTFTVYVYVYESRSINRSGKPSSNSLLSIKKLIGLSDVNAKQQKQNEDLLGKTVDVDNRGDLQKAKDNIVSAFKDQNIISGIKSLNSPKKEESRDTINPNISRILFKFNLCEWLPDESSEMLATVSNVIGERASQKIAFSYRDVEEINLYNIYSGDLLLRDKLIGLADLAALDTPWKLDSSKPGGWLSDSITNSAGFKILAPYAAMAADQIDKIASSYAGKILLGNVFGFSASDTIGAVQGILSGDPTSLIRGAQSLSKELKGSKSKKNDTHEQPKDQKYYDAITKNATIDKSMAIDNAYKNSPSLLNKTTDRKI